MENKLENTVTKAEMEKYFAKMPESRLQEAMEEFAERNESRLKELSINDSRQWINILNRYRER